MAETIYVTVNGPTLEVVDVTINEPTLEVVDVTVTNLTGATGPPGAPGPSSVAINDSDTNLTQTWSSTKIDFEITDAVSAADTGGVSAHISDSLDAHDASAISIIDSAGNYEAENVEAAFAEVKIFLDAIRNGGYTHIADETSPPTLPDVGDTWYAPDTGNSYFRLDSGGAPVWVQTAPGSGGGISAIGTSNVDLLRWNTTSESWEAINGQQFVLDNAGSLSAIDGGSASTF